MIAELARSYLEIGKSGVARNFGARPVAEALSAYFGDGHIKNSLLKKHYRACGCTRSKNPPACSYTEANEGIVDARVLVKQISEPF